MTGSSSASKPVCLRDVPLAIVVGNALDMLLCNKEAEPLPCVSSTARQEMTAVPWNKHDRTLLVLREIVTIGNLSENKGVNFFSAALERVDTVYLLQHNTLN